MSDSQTERQTPSGRLVEMTDYELVERSLRWLLAQQQLSGPNAGTWSQDPDQLQLFLTTNQVIYTLLRFGYPWTSETIEIGVRWIELQLSNTSIHIEDRANALSTLLLAHKAEVADELFAKLTSYIESAASFNKTLFAIFMVSCMETFRLPVDAAIVRKLWTYIVAHIDKDGTFDRNLVLTAYLAAVIYNSNTVPDELAHLRTDAPRWIDSNFREIDGHGWERSLTVNAWIIENLTLMNMGADPPWSARINGAMQWLRGWRDPDNGSWGPDTHAIKRVKNVHYTTAVVLRAFLSALYGPTELPSKCCLHLLDNAYRRERYLETTLGKLKRLRRTTPAAIGLAFGFLLGMLVSRLIAGLGHEVESAIHIAALVISIGVIFYFEVWPHFFRGE